MRDFVNYAIEVNLLLAVFVLAYALFLRKETDFSFMRGFMLAGLLISLLFPFIEINNDAPVLPSVETILPANWLPLIEIGRPDAIASQISTDNAYMFWVTVVWLYGIGVVVFTLRALIQVANLLRIISAAQSRIKSGRLVVVESNEDIPTFSFFNAIYLGRATSFSAREKEQILKHESVHASRFHSIDVLLVTVVGIIFWFNPLIILYKRILVHLHEFEADARAASGSDVDGYCNLLARVALKSNYFPVASHFNKSLTLKRIHMIRSIKKKLTAWKLVAVAFVVAGAALVVACQDQMGEVANSTVGQTDDIPAEIRVRMDEYLKEHPDAKLTYMSGAADEVDRFASSPGVADRVVSTFVSGHGEKGVLLTDIVQYADKFQTEEKVFMVVEKMPEFPGGYDALKAFLSQNIRYPGDALEQGIAGTVYLSMVVDKVGAVTDVKILRGVFPSIDAEAARVVKMMPTWVPARQNGKAVNVRYTLPIRFSQVSGNLDASGLKVQTDPMRVSWETTRAGGNLSVKGKVTDDSGKALPGVNVVVKGTSKGTSTNTEGEFQIQTSDENGEVVLSFVGFETKTISL